MNVASNYVWEMDPPLTALFGLLAALVSLSPGLSIGINFVVFSQPIERERWERFSFYAAKVKYLSVVYPEFSDEAFPDESIFVDMAIDRTMLVLFPNIKSLRVEQLPPRFMGFCRLMYHRTLTKVAFSFRGSRHASMEVEPAIRELSLRAPFIRDLSVGLEDYGSDDPASFISDELSRFQCLERLELPPVMVTNHVFELLAILPSLQRIDLLSPDWEEEGYVEAINNDFRVTNDAFPSLRTLRISCDCFGFDSLFLSSAFSRLVSLHLDLCYYESRERLQYCLQTLSEACKELRHLIVSCRTLELGDEPVIAETLSPLKSFPILESIHFGLHQRIGISDEELVDLIVGCPQLHSLYLNAVHLTEPKPTLTIGCLQLLAKRKESERVERLAIYVDATRNSEPLPDPIPLANLKYIFFGTSPVSPRSDIVKYLDKTLPPSCRMITFPDMPLCQYAVDNTPKDILRKTEVKLVIWDKINKAICWNRRSNGEQATVTSRQSQLFPPHEDIFSWWMASRSGGWHRVQLMFKAASAM
ncbi:hypothetical protein ACEPAG_3405 [Sanghuangporus baumii]